MEDSNELLNKLQDWVQKEGIPLEYYTSQTFMKNGFRVFQGDFVEDNKQPREIDVLAFRDFEYKEGRLRISFVVECKWSRDKPWIIFTSPTAMIAPSACIAQTIGSRVGTSVCWHIAGERPLQSLNLFSPSVSSGFSGRQAFSKDADLFYNTIQGIVQKTFLSVTEYDDRKVSPFELPAIGFPVIVVDGLLFESKYVNDSIELLPVDYSRIHWRGSLKWKHHATVFIVTKDYLETFVTELRDQLDAIGSFALSAINNIQLCYENRSVNMLNHKPGPRGIAGLPPFLSGIAVSAGP